MKDRIEARFKELKAAGRKALVTYTTGCDPNFERSLEIALALSEAGVDVLELGVPFSDPASDGPAIQAAALRALRQGASVERMLELTRAIRARCATPIVLFSYFNPLLRYGLERFCADAAAAGADGTLVVDLPPEEADELTPHTAAHSLALIRLVAPTTPPARMQAIAEGAEGFIYLITRTGVTGDGTLGMGAIAEHAAALKRRSALPVCLGFGISTAAEARELARYADGVVIGSAFVKKIAAGADAAAIGAMAAQFRAALDG